jgi:hypothetical protein
MVHQLAQCPGRDRPMVTRFVSVELGVHGRLHLVWEGVRGRDA